MDTRKITILAQVLALKDYKILARKFLKELSLWVVLFTVYLVFDMSKSNSFLVFWVALSIFEFCAF